MPLSNIQTEILRLLAAHRDPESYVGGSTPLNRKAPRYSADIDVFHDREERVAAAAEQDGALLQAHGYTLRWIRREPAIYAVVAELGGETTKLEWLVDSDFRFFPTLPDPVFGYILHPIDLATNLIRFRQPVGGGNRAMSWTWSPFMSSYSLSARRFGLRQARLWDFTPEGIIQEIRRTARYTEADFRPTGQLANSAAYSLDRYEAAVYLPLALQARIFGIVELELEVDRSAGEVRSAVAKSGHPLLVPAAVSAARQWRFRAGTTPERFTAAIDFSPRCP